MPTKKKEEIPIILCGRCAKEKGVQDGNCKCGRPVIYSEMILKRADEYLALCEDEEVERDLGNDRVEYRTKVRVPTKGGLARYLGVSRDTLYEWAKNYSEFSDVMEALGAEQEEKLINNGLSGDYNPTIAKVLLSKHGYSEKLEQEHSNPDGNLKTIVINKYGSNNQFTPEADGSMGGLGE